VADVLLDGEQGHPELVGCLLVGQASSEAAEDLSLTTGQRARFRGRLTAQVAIGRGHADSRLWISDLTLSTLA
jgi:hypothetical protein